jgi:hypothetical protein
LRLWVGSPEQAFKNFVCPHNLLGNTSEKFVVLWQSSKKKFSGTGHDWYKKNSEFYAGFKNTKLPL